jgi:hypothetical protein
MSSQCGAKRTPVSACRTRWVPAMRCEAMSLSMVLRLGCSPPCCNRNRAELGEKVADGDHLVAMGAWSTGSKPSSKNAALVAALLTKEACIALGALVDDGRGLGDGWQSRAEVRRVVADGDESHAGGRRPSSRPCGLEPGSGARKRRTHAVGWESEYRYATGFSVSAGGWRRRIEAPVSGKRCAC